MMTTILSGTTTLQKKDTLFRFFQTSTVADVIKKLQLDDDLYDLPIDSTLHEALNLLTSNNVASLPLYQINSQEEKEYITIVTTLDLLRLLRAHLSSNNTETRNTALSIKLNEVLNDKSQQMTILKSTDSLKKLLEHLVPNSQVLVAMHSKFNLISQMDLIKFLQHNNHRLGSSILDMTVPSIPKHQDLVPVNYKSTVAQSFLKLADYSDQSALPIVDDNDEFIGELNAQALRDLEEQKWSTLHSPVMMFLKSQNPPFTCGSHFTLSQIMTAFVFRRADRLWWIDINGELRGFISLSDILSVVLSQL